MILTDDSIAILHEIEADAWEDAVDLGWDPDTATRLMAVPEPLLPARSLTQHAVMYAPKGTP